MDESYLEWLSSIPGSDPGRARRIAERFPTYDQLRSATRAELASIEGLTPAAVDNLLRLLGNTTADESSHLFLCPKCGSFVGTRAEACPFCGVRFELSVSSKLPDGPDDFLREEVAPARICQTCGAAIVRDATECSVCGRRYGPSELAIHPGLEASLDDTSPFCSGCGAYLSSDESECATCGTPASAAPVGLPSVGGKGVVKDFLSRWQRMARPEVAVSEADRLGETLDRYDRLLEADPTLERAWANRAKILEKLGRGKDAAESLAKAAELNPAKEDRYRLEIQDILRTTADVPVLPPQRQQPAATAPPKADNTRLLDALAHYESLLQADPSLMVAWRTKAEILERLGRLEEARACVERAERLESAGNRSLRAAITGLQSNRLATPGPAGAGRTNGHVNGMRAGRTNGRVNGRTNGRVNGLTNGLRGRTNGLTNGLVNGLVSMRLGMTNGLTNGLGRTNGITNGLGRTNGLTNGLGGGRSFGFRSTGFRGMMGTAGWKLYLIPLVVVGLLLLPLFLVPEYNGTASPIRIDGQFGDWSSMSTEAMGSGAGLDPNVDVVRFGVVDNLGPVAFYVQVAGTALQGGGASPGTMDSVRIFVDTDGSSATGYRIDGLGADRLIEVSGYAGLVRQSTLWEFDANRDTRDWGGWIKGTGTPAAATGSQIEAEAEWLAPSGPAIPVVATVHTASWDGQDDIGDFPISPSEGSLSIVADPQVPDVISGNGISLVRLTITGHGQAVPIDSLHVQIVGTASPTAALSLRLTDGATVLDQVTPTTRDVRFSFPARSIGDGSTSTLSVEGDFSGTGGDTFGIRLPSAHPYGLAAGAVGVQENPGARTLGYLGSVPNTPRVDGGFDEWSAVRTDPVNDVSPRANRNIDLLHEGAQANGGSTFLYTDVSGRILRGTSVPKLATPTPVQGPPNTADTDRDTVPDLIDPMPLDFNNDGIPDTQTNGDYDGDLVIDYGFVGGSDYWLNTTLPLSFPPPFAGLPVSVYIGPTARPTTIGDDVLRMFLDIDNSTMSGYSIGGIGADRLAELRGKDGEVTQSALLAFSGSFPGDWSWSPVSPVTVAVNGHAVELSVALSVANVYVESGDFWGSADSSVSMPALAAGFTSFKVSAADQPLSVPWIQVGPQPMDTPIDGSSESVTTVYNHQRKVVRAGDVPGDTACDATNSDGCWYSVFYDQLPGTTPSTETITTGTKISGTFPTDVIRDDVAFITYREANVNGNTIAFDAAAEFERTLTTDPQPWTHTPVGTPRAVIVLTSHGVTATDHVIGVKYGTSACTSGSGTGGTSMTKAVTAADTSTEPGRVDIWFLGTGIPTGAQQVCADLDSATGDDIHFVSMSFTASVDTEVITTAVAQENQANPTATLAYGGRNAISAMIFYSGASTPPATTACSGSSACTLSHTNDQGSWGDSAAYQTTAGTTNEVMGWTQATDDVAVAFAAISTIQLFQLSVKYDFAGVPSGSPYTLRIQGFHTSGEDFLVQIVDSTETTWTTRLTITKTADDNTDQTYDLTTDEYDGGSPNIRFIGASEVSDTTQNDFSIDRVTIGLWDRVIIMRSSDTSGSTWGSQVVLASGRTADSALVLARDSAEPSIAIDSSGFLHVVWVSASASGDQSTLNLVRYTKTTVSYPTQSELANAANWQAVTNVDDASPGYMPTVSTDTSNNPHVAWSGSTTSGIVYYVNKAAGTWRATVSWGTTYTGLSVDVSPQNDYVSLARFYDAATDEIQYTVCKNVATSNCDAAAEFTKWDGTAGADTVVTAPEVAGYPSLAHTYEANGDVWVAYAQDVDGTTRAIYARYLDYPSAGWQTVTTVDSLSGTIFTRPTIGIDVNNDVHALYVATSGPQLYYNKRTGGSWGTRVTVGTSTDNPSLMVRAPNGATYGTPTGGLYWKTTTSETYFYIPEFDSAIVPVLGVLALGFLYRGKVRGKRPGDPRLANGSGAMDGPGQNVA